MTTKSSLTTAVVATAAILLAGSPLAYGGDDHHGHGKMMWEKCDTDKDGFISKAEFIKSKEEHFKKADKNGDGKMSKDEHKVMMDEMKEKMDD